MEFIIIIGAMIALFFFILTIKQIFSNKLKDKICVLCFTVIITWFTLLILYWLGKFDNLLLIALLMGGSILGIFYAVESRVKKDLAFFRLPFFLTLLSLGYFLLTFENIAKILFLLFILWLVFLILYLHKKNKKSNKFVKEIIGCCKKW